MSTTNHIPLPIIRLPFVRLVCILMCLIGVHSSLAAQHPQQDPAQHSSIQHSPADLFAYVPDSVDAAVVFNNPAQQLFASESGHSIHQLISKTGLFTRTQSAFDSLAQAFHNDTGQAVNALFSNRVLIAWEAKKTKKDLTLMEFVQNMDTQWAMLSEIEPDSIARLKQHFEPKPRSIEQGSTLWSIEQGRYDLVIFEPLKNSKALVLFAPKASKQLFASMLTQINTAQARIPAHRDPAQQASAPSLLDSSRPLQTTLLQMQPDAPWLAAWVIEFPHAPQPESLPNADSPADSPSESSAEPSTEAIAGLLHLDTSALSINFTSNLPLDIPAGVAPVGVLGAIGDDAVMAIALARTPTLTLYQDHFSYTLNFSRPSTPDQDHRQEQSPIQSRYAGGPGLLVFSSSTQAPPSGQSQPQSQPVMTIMTELEPNAQTIDTSSPTLAQRADQIVEDMFLQLGSKAPPTYRGRFPKAIRTQTINTKEQSDSTPPHPPQNNSTSWPGTNPALSWLAHPSQSQQSIIVALGPNTADTAAHVEWIANAAEKLDAITTSPNQYNQSNVLARGYIHPQRAIDLFDELSSMDSAIIKLIDTIQWNITRAPVGFQGQIKLILNQDPAQSQLGS